MKSSVVVLLSCVLFAGCEYFAPSRQGESPPKDPGKKLVMLPAEVWKLEKCDTRTLPYLRLDDSRISPKTVSPGGSIHYRFAYTACVPAQPGYILGRFQTDILFDGNKLSTRYDNGYPVETGKLIVDTDIVVPRNADPGTYTLEAILAVQGATLEDRVTFYVAP